MYGQKKNDTPAELLALSIPPFRLPALRYDANIYTEVASTISNAAFLQKFPRENSTA